ncbi:protein AE7-like [Papaver somniferum]|uniref:protein AE7-like n=1 Tax=Papaver somniferum TaxID=3469 RepID=UPI000E6F81BA|nr:protein AE7-like [Papaver somniferum]
MVQGLINANPAVYERKRRCPVVPADVDEYTTAPIDQLEVFNHIRDIRDTEFPSSLEELKVVTQDAVEVNDKNSHVRVTFTPTNINCEMAKTIGLCLHIKLIRSLPSRYKVDNRVAPGTHAHEAAVNERVNDKERVAGALELPGLIKMVDHCLAPTYERIGKENVYDL